MHLSVKKNSLAAGAWQRGRKSSWLKRDKDMLPIFEPAAGGELVHVAKHAQQGCREQHGQLTIKAVSPETNNDTQDGIYSYENC